MADNMADVRKRREYKTGSVFQRSSDGRWLGLYEDGFHPNGKRRRRTVSAKTEGEAKRKLRDAMAAKRAGVVVAKSVTVKSWMDEYLELRQKDLTPKAYNAAANPLRLWVLPIIGHRKLEQLTPGDIRAVHDACRAKGRSIGDVHRVLHTLLMKAVEEGHHVSANALAVKAPKRTAKSDRAAMTVAEGLACLEVAQHLPHGSRWLFTLLYGARLGESLGLTWDAVDFDAGEAVIEWQLQPLPYNVPRDRTSGFRVPDDYEARHLADAYHLVRPKTEKGWRVAPLVGPVGKSLRHWREIAPPNEWGLVWPRLNGRPANEKDDREEWWALQGTAGVGHPSGRPYHVHECRNFAATMLFELEVPEDVITDLLGHSSIATSRRYRTARREQMREAMERVSERLQLG